MSSDEKRSPAEQVVRNLESAIRNVKIATFLAAVAVCVVVANIIILLVRR